MLVRPIMKRLIFLGKPRRKRLGSLARLVIRMFKTEVINRKGKKGAFLNL